jgi:sarcosine oxidase delta subunit
MSEEMNRGARNEIFSANQAQAQGYATSNILKEDFGFEIPVENVPLPSRGIVYETDDPLHGQETLEIRAMTAKDEDILTSRALIRKGTVISMLIKSCLLDKSIDTNQMLVGDRNAIMTAIRVTGYGATYNIETQCPSCEEKSSQEFNLAELPIKRLQINPVANGSNIFEVKLPMTKKKVRFRFMTGEDEQHMMIVAERKKKGGQITDNLVTERFNRQIVSIGDVNDANKINHFIQNMPAGDSLFLRQYIDKNEPGIDMKAWMHCIQCGEHAEVRLPMGASFFWPDAG